jgi:hypothetical protein
VLSILNKPSDLRHGYPHFVATVKGTPELMPVRPGNNIRKQLIKLGEYAKISPNQAMKLSLHQGHYYTKLTALGVDLNKLTMIPFGSTI